MPSNLAQFVLESCRRTPDRLALAIPRQWDAERITFEERLTYGELHSRIRKLRAGLRRSGLQAADRLIVLIPVCVDLYALALAALAEGVAVVLIDPGMGKRRFMQAIKLSGAKAIVSADALLKHRLWLSALWGLKRYTIDRTRLGLRPFAELMGADEVDEPARDQERDAPALITYTSGSTGRPKGANRAHDILVAQHLALSAQFPAADDEVDMPCFAVIPLHNLCCGLTTVMPAVDLKAPGEVDAALVCAQIAEAGVTRMTGAAAYLTRLVEHVERSGTPLRGVRSLGAGASPISKSLCQRLVEALPDGHGLVIYGSTEAEPMAHLDMLEVLAAEGEGYLVGHPVPEVDLRVVKLPEPPPTLGADEMTPYLLGVDEVGEVVVRGAHVLREYIDDEDANRESKLRAPDGGVWHRTGDVARLDEQGRVWLLGRMADAIPRDGQVYHPFPVEAAVDALPGVLRCAWVAHEKAPSGELLVQLAPDGEAGAIEALATEVLAGRGLGWVGVVVVAEIPMDPRHGSKIDRVALRMLR